jgi:uncharacterized protein with PhoU and TrkA domain
MFQDKSQSLSFLDILMLEDGTDTLSQKVNDKLAYAARKLGRAEVSTTMQWKP